MSRPRAVATLDAPALAAADGQPEFTVSLDNFEGPFDLLLQLISRHKLDITEVSLSTVTDEFIQHVKALGPEWDLEQTTSFLVVAATLLDLKTARLLPQGEVEDDEDLALLEARDLLFARLLQYRAFKIIAGWMGETLLAEGHRHARPGGLEPHFVALLPEVTIRQSPEDLARMAAAALAPKEAATVSLSHLHLPRVSVREQATLVAERLRRDGPTTFRRLVSDADRITTVVRFLALLELFRERVVAFEQAAPLAELTIRWTAGDDVEVDIADEYDQTRPAEEPEEGEDDE